MSKLNRSLREFSQQGREVEISLEVILGDSTEYDEPLAEETVSIFT